MEKREGELSATNMDLDKACQEGRFRLNLMYRIKFAHIHLPPLREREGDISLIADVARIFFTGQYIHVLRAEVPIRLT